MNFLLEHKQKLRKPLKAYKDSSAESAKEMALGISLLPSSSLGPGPAILPLLFGFWLAQVLPELSLGRWEAREMRRPCQAQQKAGNTDQATQPLTSLGQEHQTGRAGQAWFLTTRAKCQHVCSSQPCH